MVLDLTAGNRAIWWDKAHRDAVYVDRRRLVRPDMVADSTELPLADGVCGLIVFDPPHVNFGKNSNFSRDYGHHTTAEIKAFVSGSAKEAHRVSKPDALMALKWNDHDTKLETILGLMDEWWEPLFGHKVSSRTKHQSMTYWVLLHRKEGA